MPNYPLNLSSVGVTLKIVFQHAHPLPVKTYGGIERLIYWHMEELLQQGHQVTLIGHRHCEVSAIGVKLIIFDAKTEDNWEQYIPRDTDIIHLSYNYKSEINNIPVITTIHGNGKCGEKFIKNTIFVSKSHARNHQSSQYIYNSLKLAEYPFTKRPKQNWDQFLFLGKGNWSVKNLKHCKWACRKAKKQLHIIGGKSFFPSKYIQSHGMQGGSAKLKIINQCDALVFPVRWPEPFGLAIIEALAQGIPTIGSPYGSLPELITPEVGMIVQNKQELLHALKERPHQFDPLLIRKYVVDNFSIQKYTQSYLEAYEKVISNELLNVTEPEFRGPNEAQTLLPF